MSVVTLNGKLSRISMQLRLNTPPVNANGSIPLPSPNGVLPDTPLSFKATESLDSASNASDDPQTAELFCEMAVMAGSKCSLGVAELDGKMVVCGGYDRGECLKAVESYCPEKNEWTQGANMREARGRVQIAVIEGTVYAVGGSNGTTELDTVECLPRGADKWSKCCSLPLARSNAGVCALNGQVYCIGGWNGQSGIKQCDVYDRLENKWSSISPLNTGRTQAGVTAYQGKVWAVGGSDAWNCLATVEVYSPETNMWQMGPNLLTVRRGCGLAEWNGKLYAIGGSDGNHSLNTTEVYDEETKTWVSVDRKGFVGRYLVDCLVSSGWVAFLLARKVLQIAKENKLCTRGRQIKSGYYAKDSSGRSWVLFNVFEHCNTMETDGVPLSWHATSCTV